MDWRKYLTGAKIIDSIFRNANMNKRHNYGKDIRSMLLSCCPIIKNPSVYGLLRVFKRNILILPFLIPHLQQRRCRRGIFYLLIPGLAKHTLDSLQNRQRCYILFDGELPEIRDKEIKGWFSHDYFRKLEKSGLW
ncbi:hypothetical protein [Lacrimispora aerotolerans]|uniref:hypothetical protein n=1 Tax=Lacrimispora aerotolerans TaxID=36832 RepID=UPI0014092D19|nr:hypothetical protein [Lacrimispora aerotolerans]